MNYRLKRINKPVTGTVKLESSKSESNRALIINALAGGETANITNLSKARDTETMHALLNGSLETYDVKDAGTTMRFLTAYLAIRNEEVIITGTERMKQRPIGPLVDALKSIGANIEYVENEGFPPLRIHPFQEQIANQISIPGNISSQYISALLMIAPCLPSGLTLTLTTDVHSKPYIDMTLALMRTFGVEATWWENTIQIKNQSYTLTTFSIEGDWSGASYWYSLVSLAPEGSVLTLRALRKQSNQGDIAIASIMDNIGVETTYESNESVKLTKKAITKDFLDIDFRDCPDLAQTVMVATAVNGVTLKMTGLESLKIKETDRVEAMQRELKKIGAKLSETDNQWTLIPTETLPERIEVNTYEDHRMAMAFAPLSAKMDVVIEDPKVVAKSYPGYWKELERFSS